MSDDDNIVDQHSEDMEAARIARFFLYKNREKLPVKRAQIRLLMDQVKNKKSNTIERVNNLLQSTAGLGIETCKVDPKKTEKFFLVRTSEFDHDVPLPFSTQEKKEYGLLFYIFLIIHLKNGRIELDQLKKILEKTGVTEDGSEFGKWPEIINKWSKQEYLKQKKIELENGGSKIDISYGSRFHVEFGEEKLIEMGKELIQDKIPEDLIRQE